MCTVLSEAGSGLSSERGSLNVERAELIEIDDGVVEASRVASTVRGGVFAGRSALSKGLLVLIKRLEGLGAHVGVLPRG